MYCDGVSDMAPWPSPLQQKATLLTLYTADSPKKRMRRFGTSIPLITLTRRHYGRKVIGSDTASWRAVMRVRGPARARGGRRARRVVARARGRGPSRACAGGLCRAVAHFVLSRARRAPGAWAEGLAAGGGVSLDGGATWLAGGAWATDGRTRSARTPTARPTRVYALNWERGARRRRRRRRRARRPAAAAPPWPRTRACARARGSSASPAARRRRRRARVRAARRARRRRRRAARRRARGGGAFAALLFGNFSTYCAAGGGAAG